MKLSPSKDILEFIELCLSKGVEFVIVGGYAVALHGAPRFTEDIDLYIRVSDDNASKVQDVLNDFGFGTAGVNREDFLIPGQIIQFGRKPNRIDLLTAIDGVTWDEVWINKTQIEIGSHRCWAIGLEELKRNKRASGRPQDLADLARLEIG